MFLKFNKKITVIFGLIFGLFLVLLFNPLPSFAQETTGCVNKVSGVERYEACRINHGDTLTIHAEGCDFDCYAVINSTGKDIFVPTNTCAEWDSFLIHNKLGPETFMQCEASIVFNAADKNSLSSVYEQPFIDKLQEWGYGVAVISDGEVAGYDYGNVDLLIIRPPGDNYTAHPESGLNNLPVNIISHSRHTSRVELGMAGSSTRRRMSAWYIDDGSHLLSAGYSTGNTVSVYTSSAAQHTIRSLTSGTDNVASQSGSSTYKTLASRLNGDYQRVHWAAHRGNILTTEGWGLWQNTVEVLSGVDPSWPLAVRITKGGDGSGTVTSSPSGIDCGDLCLAKFAHGDSVTLTAIPDTGSTFVGWSSGPCSGTGNCDVTVTEQLSIQAVFSDDTTHFLMIEKDGLGGGTVISNPSGINCGSVCAASFDTNASVTLTADPDSDSNFGGWSGEGCSDTGECVVSLTQNKTVTAIFNLDITCLDYNIGDSYNGGILIWCDYHNDELRALISHDAEIGSSEWGCRGTSVGASGTGIFDGITNTQNILSNCAERPIAASLADDFSHGGYSDWYLPTTAEMDIIYDNRSAVGLPDYHGVWTSYETSSTQVRYFDLWNYLYYGRWKDDPLWTWVVRSENYSTVTPPDSYSISVTKDGSGAGTVTSNPSGINCGSTCSASFSSGSSVTLSASSATGSSFAGWSGDCSGTGDCVLEMTVNRSVKATFTDDSGGCLEDGVACSVNADCCSGHCYRDQDGDRYRVNYGEKHCQSQSSLGIDCYDYNANARPGQKNYFATHRGDGSFDYRCDGNETQENATCRTLVNETSPSFYSYTTCADLGFPDCDPCANYSSCTIGPNDPAPECHGSELTCTALFGCGTSNEVVDWGLSSCNCGTGWAECACVGLATQDPGSYDYCGHSNCRPQDWIYVEGSWEIRNRYTTTCRCR